MILFIVLGSLLGLVGGVLVIPRLIQKREDKKLDNILVKIKAQKLKYRIDGKEVKFLEQVEKQLEKNKKKLEKKKKQKVPVKKSKFYFFHMIGEKVLKKFGAFKKK